MKNSLIAYVGWLLLLTAFAFYAYGLYQAIYLSWGEGPIKKEYNEVLSVTVGSMQALLLANLGMLLGISVADPGSGVARQLMLNRATSTSVRAAIPPPLALKEKVQLFALVVFIVSLVICLITWMVDDFSSDSKNVISIVSSSGKMFIGVVLAYLTAVLR